MADFGGIQGKSRLAVFEHVVEKEKQVSRRKRRYSDDSSQSESELVIGNLPVPKTKTGVNLKDEILNLHCKWNLCGQTYSNFDEFLNHVIGHSEEWLEEFSCQWKNCPNPEIESNSYLVRHLSFHGYLTKLQNIGDNIAKRDSLPECVLKEDYKIEVCDYTCEWDDCNMWFGSVTDFLYHIASHVQGVPSNSKTCNISCEWAGCSTKVSKRYKLSEHVRVHTKERFVACSKCGAMFVTKTTFADHRKRQLNKNFRRFQCSQCLKLFPTERILSDHMRTHINQYKCTLCDMTSSKPSELAKHYRYRHINYRPFKCHLCPKDFVAKCNLDTHLVTHQHEPFKCGECSKGFKSKVGLNSHMEKLHSKFSVKYQCHVCKVFMARGDNLTKHLMKKHKFHWPSGHSRFRYRKDQDGICRLQTVRYESLEVTEEMIKSESIQKQNKNHAAAFTYHVTHDSNLKDGYKVTVVEDTGERDSVGNATDINSPEKSKTPKPPRSKPTPEILISIEDIDEEGQVIRSQVIKSALVVCPKSSDITFEDVETLDTPTVALKIAESEITEEKNGFGLLDSSLLLRDESLSQGKVIATCENETIQVIKPIEFVDIKKEGP